MAQPSELNPGLGRARAWELLAKSIIAGRLRSCVPQQWLETNAAAIQITRHIHLPGCLHEFVYAKACTATTRTHERAPPSKSFASWGDSAHSYSVTLFTRRFRLSVKFLAAVYLHFEQPIQRKPQMMTLTLATKASEHRLSHSGTLSDR